MTRQGSMLLVGALMALMLVACEDNRGTPRIVGEDGSTIEVTASSETATPSAEVSSTTVSPEGTPAGTVTPGEPTATATPESTATATATPTATRPPSDGEDYEGVPYSTSDLESAIPSDLSAAFSAASDPLCANTSVAETTVSSGSGGASWALWVYPDSEAREADWAFSDGALRAQTDDCEPPTGLNYFNANVVLVLRERGEGVEEMRDAILNLSAE